MTWAHPNNTGCHNSVDLISILISSQTLTPHIQTLLSRMTCPDSEEAVITFRKYYSAYDIAKNLFHAESKYLFFQF